MPLRHWFAADIIECALNLANAVEIAPKKSTARWSATRRWLSELQKFWNRDLRDCRVLVSPRVLHPEPRGKAAQVSGRMQTLSFASEPTRCSILRMALFWWRWVAQVVFFRDRVRDELSWRQGRDWSSSGARDLRAAVGEEENRLHSLVTRRFVCTLCSWYHPSWVNSFRKIDLASRANGELGKLWPFRELRRIHASSRWRCLLRPSCNYEEEGVFFLNRKENS